MLLARAANGNWGEQRAGNAIYLRYVSFFRCRARLPHYKGRATGEGNKPMSPVELHLPSDARVVFNSLYRAPDPSFLTQDLLAIEIPGDLMIDVVLYLETYTLVAY